MFLLTRLMYFDQERPQCILESSKGARMKGPVMLVYVLLDGDLVKNDDQSCQKMMFIPIETLHGLVGCDFHIGMLRMLSL